MYKFLTTITEGVVHGVYKVVIRSSFCIIQRHKVSSGIGHFDKGELRLIEVASRVLLSDCYWWLRQNGAPWRRFRCQENLLTTGQLPVV